MENIKHPTANIQHPTLARSCVVGKWKLVVGSWMLVVSSSLRLFAQAPPQIPPALQGQLQIQQAPIEVAPPETVLAVAGFEPASVGVGDKTFYRVNVDAAESSFALPEKISAPDELKFSSPAHGQIARLDGNRFRPLTSFLFEVQPAAAGHFTVSNFTVTVAGQPVEIPAASLEVMVKNIEPLVGRRLALETSATNLFLGQPFRVRVLLPVGPGNEIEALREVQFNSVGLMTDKMSTRQLVEPVKHDGQVKTAFVHETVATPIVAGTINLSAQAFTAGRDFGGPIAISGQVTIAGGAPKYVFLTSEPLKLNVRPLPADDLPGFTGSMGKFLADKILLATNRLRVGEPVKLKYNFQPGTNLSRFVPPEPPRSRDWQIIAGKPGENVFTLIPLTDEATNTPSIPFSAFDLALEKFYDLSIPAQSVTVQGEDLPVELRGYYDPEKNAAPLKLSEQATTLGKTAANMRPPQFRGGLVFLLLLPVLGLVLLWRWDERRRFLEAHPEIIRRREAKRELKRERRNCCRAVIAADEKAFLMHAVAAMRIAVAPHYPAAARAMVCGDVLTQFSATERDGIEGEMVRKIFAAADAEFSGRAAATIPLHLAAEVEKVLSKLEVKL